MAFVFWEVGLRAADAALSSDQPFEGQQVIGALRSAGLVTNGARPLPTGYETPSGPPITEREAWAFDIPAVEGPGGRVLVFADDARLQLKAAWFRRLGVNVLVYRNVMLWLDPNLPADEVARYRQVLEGIR
jgi:hypothetical protein